MMEREVYLIPQPKSKKVYEGSFALAYDSQIMIAPELGRHGNVSAGILKDCIQKWTGFCPHILKGKAGKGDICFSLSAELTGEAYRLLIGEDGIICEGGSDAGVFYAVQTLCQIIEQCRGALPYLEITDAPDMEHRGYYLDQTRGRVFTLDALKETVDRLCRYKINEFQLYIEHTYLFRGFSELWRDETPLAAEEIMELDEYCRARHIELIPSLASFGHLYTLLSTKSHEELCELPDASAQPFSFWDRMRHHTVNVTDARVLPLIKGMLEEYLALFSSDKFNLCADETFDLGTGRSAEYAKEHGVHRMYIEYVRELCSFLADKGKQPMFWGDVICDEPFLVKELPENIICLTWGYAPDQSEDACRKMAETGVKQYLCPGVAGWNQWMNLIEPSYRNIVRMCGYAKKYHAIGILNTDWGDFGHINHPAYSIPGMIYGAAFAWNHEVIPFEELNRQISRVEYHDSSETLVGLLAQIPQNSVFTWWDAVMYYEKNELGGDESSFPSLKESVSMEAVAQSGKRLDAIRTDILRTAETTDSRSISGLRAFDLTIDGIRIWNEVGAAVLAGESGSGTADQLAERLETWFMYYKELWRAGSREGDLAHIAEIVFWYADLLRGRRRQKRRS